jgi:nitric oxide reductase NorD protein
MNAKSPLTVQQIEQLLDGFLEVEFSFRETAAPARALAGLQGEEQTFVLDLVRRAAATHVEIGHRLARQGVQVLQSMDRQTMEAWVLHAMDCYDRSGLRPALEVIDDVETYVRRGRVRASGAVLEDVVGVLEPFLQGLSGRRLRVAEADQAYTDSEAIFLPAVLTRLASSAANYRLYKATAVHLWAQTRFGTFRLDFDRDFAAFADPAAALDRFHALERIRLDACIARELPGSYRDMRGLRAELGEPAVPAGWEALAEVLGDRQSSARTSLGLVEAALKRGAPAPVCYQGELSPEAVQAAMQKRIEREKAFFRLGLKDLADEPRERPSGAPESERFEARRQVEPELPEGMRIEILLDDKPVVLPEPTRELLTSILLDLGDLPDEYLVPAGPGEYDASRFEDRPKDPDEVWRGAYHEEGAFHYNEWDCRRRHYRKSWCVVRELEVEPCSDGFVAEVMQRYGGLVKHVRKSFEALRDEDRLLKRQVHGDGIDIDALVEALADARDGREMTDRLFTRMHRVERSVAVAVMVDMSGSTKGWVNRAEREALILLSEALYRLGDRYAIYGFSGVTRKRCELFRVKTFDEPYDERVRGRISGIRPKEYTRMGAAIRHVSRLLAEVEGRTKLLVTLSDGKPEDYDGYYRGEYGIEDTRQALFEARRDGIHPYCITIDERGQQYLPRMYGAANYVVISEVGRLPFKISDIYRRLTT